MLLRSETFQSWIGGTFFEWLGIDLAARAEMIALMTHKDWAKLKVLPAPADNAWSLVTNNEMFLIQSLASGLRYLPGDYVEVGIYHGSTAKVICESKGDKTLHLCDTFEGLPKPDEVEKKREKKGATLAAWNRSRSTWSRSRTRILQGLLPGDGPRRARRLASSAFVHLDVDLYRSTLQMLGVLLAAGPSGRRALVARLLDPAGVKQAFTEFTERTPEKVIELPTTQCMLIKSTLGV